MRTLKSLLPLSVGVVLAGTVIALLIRDGSPLGTWLLAAFLAGHGLVHLAFVAPSRDAVPALASGTDFPFDLGRSWLLSPIGIQVGALRALGIALVAIVVAGYVLAALATVGILVPETWWQATVLWATVGSLALMGLFFRPGLTLGIGIDAALIWAAVGSGWIP